MKNKCILMFIVLAVLAGFVVVQINSTRNKRSVALKYLQAKGLGFDDNPGNVMLVHDSGISVTFSNEAALINTPNSSLFIKNLGSGRAISNGLTSSQSRSVQSGGVRAPAVLGWVDENNDGLVEKVTLADKQSFEIEWILDEHGGLEAKISKSSATR